MEMRELLQVDEEIRADLESFGIALFSKTGQKIASSSLLVSASLADVVEATIRTEFGHYEDDRIQVHVGNLGRVTGQDTVWLWEDGDVLDLTRRLGGLALLPAQGYHAWLTFADAIIDLTLDYLVEKRPLKKRGPVYLDRAGASYPPKLAYHYRSLRAFQLSELERYPILTFG